MRNIIIFLVIVAFVIRVFCIFKKPDVVQVDTVPVEVQKKERVFTQAEREIFDLVKRVKKFAKTLGFSETNNYVLFGETCKGCTTVYFCKDTDLPFSYFDPKMSNIDVEGEDIPAVVKELKEKSGLNIYKYDFYLLKTIGVGSGALITPRFLHSSVNYIVSVIFHEDFHKITDLPRHIDEAVAEVVDITARCLFFGMSKVEIYFELKQKEEEDVLPNLRCFEELKKLHETFVRKQINKKTYLSKKKNIVKKYGFKSAAHVVFNHTYDHYFSLMKRLMINLDYDVAKFIKVMKNVPLQDKDFPVLDSDEKFKIYLEKEKVLAIYIEKIISGNLKIK